MSYLPIVDSLGPAKPSKGVRLTHVCMAAILKMGRLALVA